MRKKKASQKANKAEEVKPSEETEIRQAEGTQPEQTPVKALPEGPAATSDGNLPALYNAVNPSRSVNLLDIPTKQEPGDSSEAKSRKAKSSPESRPSEEVKKIEAPKPAGEAETPEEAEAPKEAKKPKTRPGAIKRFLGMSVFPGGKQRAVGLDIGTRSIKIVELAERIRGYTLKGCGTMSLPPEVIVNGEVMDRELLVDNIETLVRQSGIEEKNVVVAISGKNVIIKKVVTEKPPKGQLPQTIENLVRENVPFDLDEVSVDSGVLKEQDGNIEVVLTTAKNEAIYSLINIVRDAGLTPVAIDTTPFALQNVCQVNDYITDSGTYALIDIGFETTSVTVIKDGFYYYSQDIPTGVCSVCSFTEALQKLLGISSEEALSILQGKAIEGAASTKAPHMIKSTSQKLAEQIDKLFVDVLPERELTKLILSGGGAKIPKLREFLAEAFNVPCEIVDPLRNIYYNSETSVPQHPLDVATGLALSRFSGAKLSANLLPLEERVVEKTKVRKFLKAAVPLYSLLGTFAILLVISSELTRKENKLRKDIKTIKVEKEFFQEKIAMIDDMKQKQKDIKTKVEFTQDLEKERFTRVQLLDEINRLLPGYTWLTSLAEEESSDKGLSISLTGVTTTNLSVSNFMTRMQRSPYFDDVRLSYTRKGEMGGQEITEFEIKAVFVKLS